MSKVLSVTNPPYSTSQINEPAHVDPINSSSTAFERSLHDTMVRVAMPAYNEAESLPLLIPRIAQALEESPYRYDIIVVDDGSQDDTEAVVDQLSEKYPVRCIPHGNNRGLGAAITTAVTSALEGLYPDDIVVTLDADNTHPPQTITKMVPMIREGRDIVIASRFQPGARVIGLSRFREWTGFGASLLMRTLFGLRGCRDYTCGYRAYRVETLRNAVAKYRGELVQESGFASMAELLLNVAKDGAVIGEVPLLLRYDFKPGASKMKVFQTIMRTLRMVARHRFSR